MMRIDPPEQCKAELTKPAARADHEYGRGCCVGGVVIAPDKQTPPRLMPRMVETPFELW